MTKEDVYDLELQPLLDKVLSICKSHDIAMFLHLCLDGELRVTYALPLSKDEEHNEMISELRQYTGM